MNISLPETLRGFVDSQVQSGEYGTSSEYIRELIREDQKKRLNMRLNRLLMDGIESGPPIIANAAYWRKKRKQLTTRLVAKK